MLWPSVVDKGVQEIAKGLQQSGARKIRHLWVV